MQIYRKYLYFVAVLGFLAPVVLTVLVKIFRGSGIGPVVFFLGLSNAVVFPVLIAKSFWGIVNKAIIKVFLAIASIAVGVSLAVLSIDWFIFLTAVFKMFDYELM